MVCVKRRLRSACLSSHSNLGLSWLRGYKTFSMLNEILNAHKFKNIKRFGLFLAHISLECYFPRS